VDAAKAKDFDLAKVNAEELPEDMRKLNESERRAYVEKAAKERSELQAKIVQLNAEREKYVAQQTKAQSGTSTLDQAVIGAIREQGQKRNLKFD